MLDMFEPCQKCMELELTDPYLAVSHGNPGIPKLCPCGGHIIEELVVTGEGYAQKYYRCISFEDNGLHIRKRWELAMEEEVILLKCEVEASFTKLQGILNETHRDLAKIRGDYVEPSQSHKDLQGRLESILGRAVLPCSPD